MMCGVQHPAPKDPDSFPNHIKKRTLLKPPFLFLVREQAQARESKLN
jgi:hypothetical protein